MAAPFPVPFFYASVGARLTRYALDPATLALRAAGSVDLPSPIHYVWKHPRLDLLYVATSRRFFTPHDDQHLLSVVAVDAASGALSLVGTPVPLQSRPIHVTVDAAGAHALVVFNIPPGIAVYRLGADGAVGAEVPQDGSPPVGIYPHQVRLAPHDAFVVVPARGNNATATRPEDPGGLHVFGWRDGQLVPSQVVAPDGGRGFGPRHVDFHSTEPWMYVSLERQQQLQVYAMEGGRLGAAPLHSEPTLDTANDAGAEQLAGAVHVHPSGDYVYVANRTDTVAGPDGNIVYRGGDNTMAVFAIDRRTGAPRRIQNVGTGSFHIRTFSLAGDVLVGASLAPCKVHGPDGMHTVPARLSFFRIGGDGRLTLVRTQDVDTTGGMQFWCGFLDA